MHDIDQQETNALPEEPLESVAPGVSLLESILLLLTPEQQQHFLESAGVHGVVYANRAPTFDKPLALKINKPRFRALLELIGCPAREISPRRWECNYDDPEPLEILKQDLEAGVRVFPPPRDWFGNHPEGDDVPIRIESQRFGIPCRVRPHIYGGTAYLEAMALGPPDISRQSDDAGDEDPESPEEELEDAADIAQFSDAPSPATVGNSVPSQREFSPHFVTSWNVLGPNSRLSPEFDRDALGRLVSQLVANGRHSALLRATRERCDILQALIRLKKFASQYPYVLVGSSRDSFEFEVSGPPETVNSIKRVYLYRDVSDGTRRDRVPGIVLERAGRRRKTHIFRVPEGYECALPPASGYLVDTGDISQLQKQLDALRELTHPGSRPHLIKLGSLLSSDNGNNTGDHEHWHAAPLHLIDGKLTDRQSEAVQKALATPDVCLIQGPPGTGKTRVISEIVRQAVRKNWKVLLVAPTHVAVDNVLERIGMQEEVSPVRCVRQDRLDELPEHIQELTYERRSGLLAHETIRRTESDCAALRTHVRELAAALDAVANAAQHRHMADTLETRIEELRQSRARVPQEVRAELAEDIRAAADAENSAKSGLDDATSTVAARQRDADLRTRRITELEAHDYTSHDHQRFDQAAALVREDHAPGIEAATSEIDSILAQILALSQTEAERQDLLDDGRKTLSLLDRGVVLPRVQAVVDTAVAKTTQEHDAIVNACTSALNTAKSTYATTQRKIGDCKLRENDARSRTRSLKATQQRMLPLRLISGNWWGSFFTDYERTAAEASKQIAALQAQCPTMESAIHEREQELADATAARQDAIRTIGRHILEHQHDHYRSLVATIPAELASIRSERDGLEEGLRTQRASLESLKSIRQYHLDTARSAVHSELMSEANTERDAAVAALKIAHDDLDDMQHTLMTARAQVEALADRVNQMIGDRTTILTHDIEAQEHELDGVREQFETAIAPLRIVRDTIPPFDSEGIEAVRINLQSEHDNAVRRMKLLDEWAQYLGGDSATLASKLSKYVNLVCATTVGIASDEYFGDRGEFVEKDFDLLVVDEAGKVTEPELLVAAVRAKRWVLVGDHKQLPPYYDEMLNPYIRSANDSRQASDQPVLDPDMLQKSIFERLWCKYDSGQSHGDRCVTLDIQRRMHPDLAVFVSDMFYGGRYYSPDDDAYRQSKSLDLQHFPKPVTFIDLSAGHGSDGYEIDLSNRDQRRSSLTEHDTELPERGYANLREAEQVVQVLEAITNDPGLEREQSDLDRDSDQVPVVGVIALYAGQVALIHRLIRSSNTLRGERVSVSEWLCGNMRISVNTVDAFQGKECPVIILSFTRSNRRHAVGFVDDANRLNVALSRARKKLILIGDSATLTRHVKDSVPGGKDSSRAATAERECFVRLLRYVEGHGKTMRVFERRVLS